MTKEQIKHPSIFNQLQDSVSVRGALISIRAKEEFAILRRNANEDGLIWITFSIPLTVHDTDIIDKSGIAEVKKFSKSGTLVFTRKSFYEPFKMIDLIRDILMKYEAKEKSFQRLA